ncbi:hypothetical protein SAMN03159362_2020 [Pseudomonas sp. NFIX51]|uniref:hypothetical protein n=1 Tax=Pseudomonas TaxID=286 RepID=UPI0008C288ED|nr:MULTISPECIES: hypothetical protein [Pseudomonas]AZD08601.1 hypothetical protein C4K26_3198 [Pseudomonas chlororaphis]SEK85343.1 hypothetical protein SAMN03159414_1491 [Pseudomonas sp. NFACC41-3]SMH43621.1 hypothetical protein SAMN03159362_2020 [Pseudomonas sp. NFIX51]
MTTRFNQPQAPQKAGGHPRHRHDGKQASTFFAPAVSSVAVLSADARLFSAIGFHIGGCWIAFFARAPYFLGVIGKGMVTSMFVAHQNFLHQWLPV